MDNKYVLEISWETIGKIFIAVFLVYLLFLAQDIVIWFFFALVVSLLVNPAITFFMKFKLPRIVATILVYLFIFGALGLMIYLTAPLFIFEINELSQHIPEYFEKVNPILREVGIEVAQNFEDFTATLLTGLKASSAGIIQALTVLFGGIYSTLIIFTLAFFISLEKNGTEKVLMLLTPKKYESSIVAFFERAQVKVSGWFAARILACVLVGAASFILFLLLGVPYAFILALISGVLNFIPYIGPTATFILDVVFVGVTDSWVLALYAGIALLVIQEIEGKFLTPVLMKKFMNMPAVLVLLSLLIGHTVFGFLGMIFAVPVFGIAYEFSREYLERKREEEASYYSNSLE